MDPFGNMRLIGATRVKVDKKYHFVLNQKATVSIVIIPIAFYTSVWQYSLSVFNSINVDIKQYKYKSY